MHDQTAMKDSVVVVSMDPQYGDQARQVLSGLHRHAGWRGDYMLLCHGVAPEETNWFAKRGVHIEHVPHLFCNGHLPAVTFSRYVLFQEWIHRWKHVIFLDLDMIIRGGLSALVGLGQLGAVRGYKSTIRENFVRDKDPALYDQLDRAFDLDQPAFNGGLMAFPTHIIQADTYDRVCELTERYLPISRFANQGLLNLLFAGSWTQLSPIYNAYVPTYMDRNGKLLLKNARIIHFNGPKMKPWDQYSVAYEVFFAEWLANLRAADAIARFHSQERWSIADESTSVLMAEPMLSC